MEDTFVLKIQLGNDSMKTGLDVGNALRSSAEQIDLRGELSTSDYGYVIDANGNKIGSWEIQ